MFPFQLSYLPITTISIIIVVVKTKQQHKMNVRKLTEPISEIVANRPEFVLQPGYEVVIIRPMAHTSVRRPVVQRRRDALVVAALVPVEEGAVRDELEPAAWVLDVVTHDFF